MIDFILAKNYAKKQNGHVVSNVAKNMNIDHCNACYILLKGL